MKTSTQIKSKLDQANEELQKAEAACESFLALQKKYQHSMEANDLELSRKYGNEMQEKIFTIDNFFVPGQKIVATNYRNLLMGVVSTLEYVLE